MSDTQDAAPYTTTTPISKPRKRRSDAGVPRGPRPGPAPGSLAALVEVPAALDGLAATLRDAMRVATDRLHLAADEVAAGLRAQADLLAPRRRRSGAGE